MSETVFKFLLSELSVVRIHCRRRNCVGIAEVPIERLGGAVACPLCATEWKDEKRGQAVLAQLGAALEAARQNADVAVEFVLPSGGNG